MRLVQATILKTAATQILPVALMGSNLFGCGQSPGPVGNLLELGLYEEADQIATEALAHGTDARLLKGLCLSRVGRLTERFGTRNSRSQPLPYIRAARACRAVFEIEDASARKAALGTLLVLGKTEWARSIAEAAFNSNPSMEEIRVLWSGLYPSAGERPQGLEYPVENEVAVDLGLLPKPARPKYGVVAVPTATTAGGHRFSFGQTVSIHGRSHNKVSILVNIAFDEFESDELDERALWMTSSLALTKLMEDKAIPEEARRALMSGKLRVGLPFFAVRALDFNLEKFRVTSLGVEAQLGVGWPGRTRGKEQQFVTLLNGFVSRGEP